MQSNVLETALSYARRGWPVFPCKPRAKVPDGALVGDGLQSATTDEVQIRAWWAAHENDNVAIVTGIRSGFFVLDVDLDHGGDESLAELLQRQGELPATVEALTGGGGRHLLYRYPAGQVVRNTTRLAGYDGIDVRGEGGYIIAPPSIHPNGEAYTWEVSSHPDDTEIAEAPAWLLGLLAGRIRVEATASGKKRKGIRIQQESEDLPAGRRNDGLIRFAGKLRREGLEYEPILAALQAENLRICRPPLGEDEVEQIAQSIMRYTPELADAPELAGYEQPTDMGNGVRLIARFGHEMRYCYAWGRWLVWDGRRWAVDEGALSEHRAKETARGIWDEARRLEGDAAVKMAKHAVRSQNAARIEAMLKMARSEPGTPIGVGEMDRDPWLLNVGNGMIDLQSGRLYPHDSSKLCTKIADVPYEPDARSELWERYLRQATDGDEELEAFLRRAAGYSLTGLTSEEVLFFVHGPGAAGKSTFLKALQSVLGDYADVADFDSFISRPGLNSGPRNDIAKLVGKRFVLSIEVDEGEKMAQGVVKMLTGGDAISARMLYREAFTFEPECKLWLAANHAPKVNNDDDAMWRRILRVPFDVVIPEGKRDPAVKAQLSDPAISGAAILSWAVRGCLEWQQYGLRPPASVKKATEAYRDDNDPLRDFLADCCVLHPTATVGSRELGVCYEAWCSDNRQRPLQGKAFAAQLKLHGCKQTRLSGGTRAWAGIRLATAMDYGSSSETAPAAQADGEADGRTRWAPDIERMLKETFGDVE